MRARRIRRKNSLSVVSIAGSDSGGGAGIQADLVTFAAHGLHGTTVLVAATAQDTRGIDAVFLLPPRFVARQMDVVFGDFSPAAVKIGMLGNAGLVRAVAAGLRRHGARNVVLDPVLASTAGVPLLSPEGVDALRRDLLPLCDLVTPNLPEAARLARLRIRNDDDRRRAARRIAQAGARAVLVTGGHGRGARVRDLLWDGRRFRVFDRPRIDSEATHGTGCTLSAAIAANLALGLDLDEAVSRGIRYLRSALRRGVHPGGGAGTPGRLAPTFSGLPVHSQKSKR